MFDSRLSIWAVHGDAVESVVKDPATGEKGLRLEARLSESATATNRGSSHVGLKQLLLTGVRENLDGLEAEMTHKGYRARECRRGILK